MRRFAGLDALRGIAALIVVIHHASLTFPAFVGGATPTGAFAHPFPGDQWAVAVQRSPLNIFFAGPEAVYLFFVLSGFVLTLPFDREARPGWLSYYPKRLVRLYLPIVASVLLALATIALVPRVVSPEQTWWVNAHLRRVSVGEALRDMFVLLGTGRFNSVLWSLRYEVIFSLLLPVYLLVGRLTRKWWVAGVAGMVALSCLGSLTQDDLLLFLPMFGVGVYIGLARHEIDAWARRTSSRVRGFVAARRACASFSKLGLTGGDHLPRARAHRLRRACGRLHRLATG